MVALRELQSAVRSALLGGDPAAVLTLIRLKPGVSRQDVVDLARELGLTDIILY